MDRHILKLAKASRLWQTSSIDTSDGLYTFDLYTYYNASGFVHFARLSKGITILADAKAQYINRTWERFTGASVYNQALSYAINQKDITQQTADEIKAYLEKRGI
jgi:hypothetical protein